MRSLALLLLLASAAVGEPARFESPLGYSVVLPSGWAALTQESVRAMSGVFQKVAQTDPKLAESLRADIEAGRMDVLIRTDAIGSEFLDNINARTRPAEIPLTQQLLELTCVQILKAAQASPPEVEGLEECSYRAPGGHHALYLRKRAGGKITLQYQVLTPESQLLAITVVAAEARLDVEAKDLDLLVDSIQFAR